MSLKTTIAKIAAWFAGHHVGEELSHMKANALREYDAAVDAAHAMLANAEADIQHVAAHELAVIENLYAAAKRRIEALPDAGVLHPDEAGRAADLRGRL